MATTAVSSSTTSAASTPAPTAASIAATNKANAQKIMTSMGAGSGVDVTSLAQSLVNAEKLPKQNEINTKITKNDARVSGYSAVMFMMTELNKSFTALKDRNNFNALSASNSNTSAFDVIAGETAVTGHHDIEVTRLAKPQRTVSAGVASATASLNGGKAMSLSIKVGDASAVARSVTTRQGVAAVNESASVTFQDLAVGERVTVGGLTYTATQATTAADLADAFANASTTPANGTFSGSLTGFTAASAANAGTLVFNSALASTNVTDLTVSSTAAIAPVVATSQGVAAVTERTTVTFKDMLPGESITVGGLKYTATITTTAAQVATAFSGLQADAATPSNPLTGTFTGTLTGFNGGVSDGTGALAFTSSTTNANVTDLPIFGSSADISLVDGKDTPQGIVDAINASKVGVTAQLVNTGDGSATPYQIILSGPVGLTGAFSINTSYGAGTGTPGLTFPAGPANQTATDALVKVDGINYTRSSNTLVDVVPGLTLNLKATTSSAASVDLTRDNTILKDKFTALVTAYNDADNILAEVSNPKSTLDTYGATLVGDSTVRSLRQQLRSMISGLSSTPGDNVKSMAQMGVNVDQKGVMSLDATKLDAALTDHYSDVVKSFTGGYNNLGTYSTLSAGFAGDAVKKITNIIGNKGALTTNTTTANTQNTKYKADLEKLNTRMDSLLARYTKQFSAMDSLVGQVNSQKTSLKSTFDGMMASYTKA
jgi:flagellar hook-associated protein 2